MTMNMNYIGDGAVLGATWTLGYVGDISLANIDWADSFQDYATVFETCLKFGITIIIGITAWIRYKKAKKDK